MGLKFTPTPEQSNSNEIDDDLSNFFRKIRLREYYYQTNYTNDSVVKNSSNFCPPNGRNEALDNYISTTKILCSNALKEPKSIKHNISLEQRKALRSLANDKSIIIKEADKGGGIVIMNVDFYKKKILEMLDDNEYYQEIPTSNKNEVFSKIKSLINKNGKLTKHEIDYLLKFESKTSTFYGLPKIHKCQSIQKKCKDFKSRYVEVLDPDDLAFRPIVAGPICETSRLSSLADQLLKPFLTLIPSYVRDDIDFLNFIPKQVSDQTKLVSFDIVSLYTNIPHDLGIEAISYWLSKNPELLGSRFDKMFIIESLKIILENNIFVFNNKYYNQRKGTAMGTKVAPTYATLVLAYLETILYKRLQEEDNAFALYVKQNWKRYLDDCFIFWERPIEDLIRFEKILNSLHKDIQFKMQVSDTELPFLDILLIKKDKHIITDIFYKVTDSKQYLNFSSCHPKHTKINVPFSLARRICTIVGNKTILKQRLSELANILIKRQYPKEVIKTGLKKALEIPRHQLLCVKKKSHEQILPFISTHNPKNKNVFGIVKQNLQICNNDTKMKNIISDTKIINCKRQLPNLKRFLIKSEFKEQHHQPKVSKCNDIRCGLCDYLIEGAYFTTKSNMTFHVKQNMNCSVENVLYALRCNGCDEIYIGQTGDKLRNRRTVHEQQMRDPSARKIPLSGHLDTCCKSEPKFSIFPFYKFNCVDASARLSKEKFFITIFKPKLNIKL